MTPLKNVFKLVANKRAYPRARIAFGSRVTGKAILGADVEIGRRCYVYRSTLGKNVRIKDDCSVFDSKLDDNVAVYQRTALAEVELGSYSYVAERSQLAGVRTGCFCSIGPEFLGGYGDHPAGFVSTSPVFYSTAGQCGVSFAQHDCFQEKQEIVIGNDVWIGARVFVRDGMKIGNGALIAAGAVVVSDIPDYAIAGGVPAKVIRYRFDERTVRELIQLAWWSWPEEKLRQAQPWFAQNDVRAFLDWAGIT